MSAAGILSYTLRAVIFAAAVWGLWTLVNRIQGKGPASLSVFYLAALTEIIALRGGPGHTRQLCAIPFQTLAQQARAGLWPFVYHTVGNLIWFVPLGAILRKQPLWKALLLGAGVSMLLEAAQFALGTGITDIDDVILNALGTVLGTILFKSLAKRTRNASNI